MSRISSSLVQTSRAVDGEDDVVGAEPARSAGDPALTSCTSAPRDDGQLSERCRSGVTSVSTTPMNPRDTLPARLAAAAGSRRAWLIGTAKPMLLARELIAELMPMTSPRALISGPPLLPKLIAASVWM